jgi:hypothetical protein
VVHDRRVDGEELTLGVSGKVRDGNLVMYDKKTGSLWLQKSGAALEGTMKGKFLKELPSSNYEAGIRWDEWRAKHPTSKVLHCEHCLPRPKKRTP